MYVPSFDDLVGDQSAFFADYFGRAPLLRRGALDAAPYADLLTVSDLDNLLYSEIVRPPHIRLSVKGRDIPPPNYARAASAQGNPGELVDPAKVLSFFRAGATITWNSLGQVRPNLRALTASLAERFSTRADVNAVFTPAGQEGFLPHHDPVDVFVIQLHGVKRWRVWSTASHPDDEITHYTSEELGEPLWDVSLHPGDILYLPNGTPHVAVAEDAMSLHLSALVFPRRWSDLVKQLVGNVLDGDPDFAGFPYLDHARGAELGHDLAQLLARLTEKLTARRPAQVVQELIDEPPNSANSEMCRPFAELADAEMLSETCLVSRHPDNSVDVAVDSAGVGKAVVSVQNTKYAMPAEVAARLSELAAGGEVRAGGFLGGGTEMSLRTVRTLARIGAIRVRRG